MKDGGSQMRKFVSLLAVLLALVFASAQAFAESAPVWNNGQSPSQPYKGVPPVDLTQKLGYMVFTPLNNDNADDVLTSLTIYLPREDVKAGEGALSVYEKDGKAPLEVVSFSDAARVSVAPIDQETLNWLYWESGVAFTVRIANALDADKGYYVSMEENCIVSADGAVGNIALDGKKGWAFTTNAEAGVTARTRSGDEALKVGDSVRMEVKLGGDATSAMVFCDTEAVSSEDHPLTESGTLTARYEKAGSARWGVAFMDEAGSLLSVYYYEDEVQG